jgi:flavin reductase (DIM6/NTAB) family NADH-FMN oxidoreductase RutF
MRKEVELNSVINEVMDKLNKPGLLLGTGEKCNPMTIGWGSYGIMWNKPVFTVMVRPVRFSFDLMEKNGDFTINVPSDEMKKEVGICGTKSGRDLNKIEECGYSLGRSEKITVPYINECPIHLECRTIFYNDVTAGSLDKELINLYYPHADLHRYYYGEILGAYIEE